jgi:bifunctional non-homologous end joining protein LigD
MPDRLSPQLATLTSETPKGKGWAYEIKFDGYRILARSEGGKTRLVTHNSNDWTGKMETLAREISLACAACRKYSLLAKLGWVDHTFAPVTSN